MNRLWEQHRYIAPASTTIGRVRRWEHRQIAANGPWECSGGGDQYAGSLIPAHKCASNSKRLPQEPRCQGKGRAYEAAEFAAA